VLAGYVGGENQKPLILLKLCCWICSAESHLADGPPPSQVASGLARCDWPAGRLLALTKDVLESFSRLAAAAASSKRYGIHRRICKAWPCRCPYESNWADGDETKLELRLGRYPHGLSPCVHYYTMILFLFLSSMSPSHHHARCLQNPDSG